ncbi:MAG: cupin domain-containing protein [Clostridium sp.]|nr:cupin domain-containing protein [Clostridium sp.]
MEKIKFFGENDAIKVHKDNGTDVSYYIFNEFEIHRNKIEPKSIQEWHYHSKIEETLMVIKGKLTCRWLEDSEERSKKIIENEIVRVGNSTHTFENETDEEVQFIVFRFVPEGLDKREIIKSDKVIVNR